MSISLKGARANANLTLKQVASILGVNERTVWLWEHGESAPNIFNALALEEIYGIDVHDLFFLKTHSEEIGADEEGSEI